MTFKMMKSNMMDKVVMNESWMMTKTSGAWHVARSAIVVSMMLIGLAVTANAAVLAQYSFPTNQASPAGNINPSTSGTGLTVSPITNGATNVYEVSSNGYTSDPELRVGPQATTLGGAVTANSYVQFTLTPDAGNELDLTSMTLNAARGGGATPRGWGLRSSLDGYASNIDGPNDIPTERPTWTGYNVDLSGASYQNLTSAITFRIYFYSPAAGSTVEMDDIVVNGTVALSGGGDPAHCSSGVQDGDETGIDCGGSCSATCGGGSCDYDIDPLGTYIEAENFSGTIGAPNPWSWEIRTNTITDGNGNSNSGDYFYTTSGGTGANTNGSRVDYPITITSPGTYEIWIRALDQTGAGGGDSVFWGVNGSYVGAITQSTDNTWAWSDGVQNGTNQYNFASAGDYMISMWPRETGQHFDSFVLYQTGNPLPFTGNNDTTTVEADLAKTIDPSCIPSGGGGGGGGSGSIIIPEGQNANGTSLSLVDVDLTTYDPGTINANEIIFDSNEETPLQYRALGGESDGFHGFSLDSKWTTSYVGNDVPANAPSVSSGTLSIEGSGQDIWNTNDFFTYLYQSGKSGDFTIDVYVGSVENTNQWAKAGIMVRQGLSTNSRHAMMVVTPSNGARLQYRPTEGAASQNPTPGNANAAPKWLRLKRTGNTFEGFWSDDAVTWTSAGTATVTMTDPVNIGLAVTSHSAGVDCTATFDDFMFRPVGPTGMADTWTADIATAIDAGNWTDGVYGVAIKSSDASPSHDTNTFDYSSCTDGSPSTITIPVGQTVQGSAVSLSALFAHTGNVGSFTYEIDGTSVNNPWNSYSVEPNGSSGTHTLRVAGTDPDCGGSLVAATGTITVDNTCIDATPSTITILTGQSVGGASVDLTALHSTTGSGLGALTYKINGVTIATPDSWDSTAFGGSQAEDVTLEISGVDSDCGTTIVAINTISVDNTCVRNEPSISFDREVGYVGPGRAIPYQVTIRNEDSFNCSPSSFDVDIIADPVNADFEASFFNPTDSNKNITLNGRETFTFELAVKAKKLVADGGTATEWNEKDVTLEITGLTAPQNATHNNGVTAGKTQGTVNTKIFLVSPITHNSVTTVSSKWGGNWGTSQAGSKYGNFDCLTCHSKTGSEIKWMRGTISTPDGTNWESNGSPSVNIVFKDARGSKEIVAEGGDPVTDVYWGHDDPNGDGSGHATSDRVCEVCHSQTMYHRYDTSGQDPSTLVVNQTHFPSRDCTDCHRHSLGFTASCTGCHGDPPLTAELGGPNGLADIPAPTGSTTPGTHYKHTVTLGYPCEYCHDGWRDVGEMPKEVVYNSVPYQDINHLFRVFNDRSSWGGGLSDVTDSRATDGHYTGQDGVSYEGTLVAPGAGTMTCENIYCHGGADDPAQPGSNMGGNNPQWNGNITCNACHGTSSTNTPPGYSHTTHVGEMGLACTACHFTNGQQPGYNGHVNGSVNIQMDLAGVSFYGGSKTYPVSPSGTAMYDPTPGDGGAGAMVTYDSNQDGTDLPPSNSYGTCLNIACHNYTETPVWNNAGQEAQCNDCHNDGAPDDTDATTQLQTAAPNTGNHEEHVHPSSAFTGPDAAIHENMVGTFVDGCQSCHGGGANSGDHPGHINFSVDIGGGMTYSQPSGDGGTCTSQCHSLSGAVDNGGCADTTNSVVWGSPERLSCEACHTSPYIGPTVVDPTGSGTGMAASGYGSHLKVTKGQTISASTNWTRQCRSCHPYHYDDRGVTGLNSYVEITPPPTSWDNPGTAAVETDDMRSKLGLNYPVTGMVHLGGCDTETASWYDSGASNATEAEMCWGCHGTDTELNEWGYNHKLPGSPAPPQDLALDVSSPAGHTFWNGGGAGNRNHNYGYLYTANHTTGTYSAGNATAKWVKSDGTGNWRQDAYQHTNENSYALSRRITSVHSVNFNAADQVSSVSTAVDGSGNVVPTNQEVPADIKCSYCHDVHDLNRAVDEVTLVQESATGAPFLRGTWMANPYASDMPPLDTYSYPTTGGPNGGSTGNRYYSTRARNNDFAEPTPRLYAGTDMSVKGGYFIDANSGWPTANANWDTLQETAGICITCHGTDVDNMDFYTSSTLWMNGAPANGHANSTLGGSGAGASQARDLFDARRGQTYNVMAIQIGLGQGSQYGQGAPGWDANGPFRNDMDKAMDQNAPQQTPEVTGWYGGNPGDRPNNTGSRPAQYSTWYSAGGIGHDGSGSGAAHKFSCSKCHSPHATGLPALLTTSCIDTAIATWTRTAGTGGANPVASRANNCHRKTSVSDGWNRLNAGQ